jgi:hypothetical protein
LASGTAFVAHAQVAEIAAGATTGAVVDGLISGVNNSIEKARQAGDYVTAVALARVLEALDAYKKANESLLDKAYSTIDQASRENFGRIRSAIIDADATGNNLLAKAAALGDSANQLIASLPGGRPYISRFQPRIVPPTAIEKYSVRINGVSLDKAEPVLALQEGRAQRAMVGPNEVQFSVPLSFTPRNPNAMQLYILPVTYTQPKAGFWSWVSGATEQVSRQLPIIALPANLATFKVEGERKFERREVEEYSLDLGQYRGSNEDITRAGAPRSGWKWDAADQAKFTVWGTGGKSASCQEIVWGSSNEYSLSVRARVDRIGRSFRYPNGAPGRITCHVRGPIYRMVQVIEPIQEISGTLGWLEDKSIKLPEGTSSYRVTVTTFDGRKRVFSNDDGDKFFDLRHAENTLTLVPRVPADIL